ncbi:MAG: pirin family protein [Candidatus Bathyarchaeia archaeon]
MKRNVKQILKSKATIEGAGVRLKRVFGYNEVPLFDPFLLLDNFGSENPEDYIRGFPWHPHRGIETVTYMLSGQVEHGDSIGNSGLIRTGDVQWMTAGSGIIHQEMPRRYEGLMQGFQLWVNLPAKKKMIDPRYRGITGNQIPVLEKEGAEIKVIAGTIDGTKGPVQDLVVDVDYFDVELAASKTFEHSTERDSNVFAYVIKGSGYFDDKLIESQKCALFSEGDSVRITTEGGIRFLFVSGKPLKEPVAWGGPIVMNTQEELAKAFQELDQGTFIKTGRAVKPSRNFYRS